MDNNKLVNQDFYNEEFKKIFDNSGSNRINPGYFLSNYKSLMRRYIANGNPSLDTCRSYFSAIDQFLDWCEQVKMNPFNINEQHLLYYRSILINNNFSAPSVKFKLTAIRRFYYVARKYKLVNENPAEDVHAQRDPDAYMPVVKYITDDQLQDLLDSFDENDEIELRTKAIISLMALEGLRTIEVHRLNEDDIDFRRKTIYVRGKGHNDLIYPRQDTLDILNKYINKRYVIRTFDTPVFTSTSNNNKGNRISRQNIRNFVDEILTKQGLKKPGESCHMFRHTCGTLLYSKTKDLQVVKEVLRHRSIEVTSRYAHIQDAMLKRYTEAIPIKNDKREKENIEEY